MSAPKKPPGGTRLETLIHHHDLTTEYKAKIETYAGNGTFNISDDAFLDFVAAFVVQDGPQTLFSMGVMRRLQEMRSERPIAYRKAVTQLRGVRMPDGNTPWWPDVEAALDALPAKATGTAPIPRTSTALMAKEVLPPVMYINHLLPHGMTLLAGRKKKGKSTMALDMALAIATGRQAFRKLSTIASKVLYVSLEDDEDLICERLRKIQPNFSGHPNFQYLLEWPRLNEPEAVAWLEEYVANDFRVVFIDVLGRVQPAGRNKIRQSYDEYMEMTDVLGPLQRFANEHRMALVFLDHVRKTDADDLFDTIQGSGAKWGVADHGIIYERRFRETDAVLQLSSRRLGDNTMRLTMVDGHLEFLGMGEEYETNAEETKIMKILSEEKRPMDLRTLMSAVGVHQGQYARFRTVMYRLYAKGIVGKTKRGLYTIGDYEGDTDDVPF